MAVVEELIRIEENGTISFGNYKLEEKSKKSDFEFKGDLYKVKTCKEITKLERNGLFVYESVPGTAVNSFKVENGGVSFEVESDQNAQITVELEESTEYVMYLDGVNAGSMTTNLSGKLSLSVPASNGTTVVKIVKE
ncbi:MAG: endosialidase [Lachnospiraceae bacterium]|nr:endosialidase [Lachnospiraceae bacterium]